MQKLGGIKAHYSRYPEPAQLTWSGPAERAGMQHAVHLCIAHATFLLCVGVQVIAAMPNVCNYLHMPAQSGSSSTLQRMKRGYTREAYDALVARAREVIPNVALSTDMITGNEGMPCRTRLRLSRCLSVQGHVYI